MAGKSDMREKFDTQVNMQHEDKRVGLVVIMGVVNKHGPQGTDIDVNRVRKTFQDLNFATWVINDPTPDKVREAVKIVTEYNFPLSFRGIIVYYAGHGGSCDEKGFFFLPCDDDKHEMFLIDSEVIAPFQPKNKECRLSNRYRLFLFDCCLKEDANSGKIPTAQTVIEPDLNLPPYQPQVDYTLVAHAAYVREASKGKFWDGGVWTHYLCDNIKSYGSTKTIGAILNITREDVIKKTAGKVQAPFYKAMGGDVMLFQGTVPSTDPHIPTPPAAAGPGPSDDDIDIDIDKIMDARPDKGDLMTVLDGIKDDTQKWREYFGKRFLKGQLEVNNNFTELEFLIDEITEDHPDDYEYTWRSVIQALDKPSVIEIGSKRQRQRVSEVVIDHLNNRDVYEKYIDQLKSKPN